MAKSKDLAETESHLGSASYQWGNLGQVISAP